MFLKSCCQSLTVHQFDNPPSVVLDLGCGGGYWSIEAAKQWKVRLPIDFAGTLRDRQTGKYDNRIRSKEHTTQKFTLGFTQGPMGTRQSVRMNHYSLAPFSSQSN
jgi:hypothetical protein